MGVKGEIKGNIGTDETCHKQDSNAFAMDGQEGKWFKSTKPKDICPLISQEVALEGHIAGER